jgi:hypothetical protein
VRPHPARAAADALTATACKPLETIGPTTKPAARKSLVATYKGVVELLRKPGWLTPAPTLRNLADTL